MKAVSGYVAPGFESVHEAFARCFSEMGEEGAGYAAFDRGRLVVDLRGGELGQRSLANIYSVGKAVCAFSVLALADRGDLSLDDPVARHWPAFAAAGKESVTVRQVLSHQAGVPALREPLAADDLFDWDLVCSAIAAEKPWFEPGSAHAEHVLTYGHLCGELIRRVDGRSIGQFWREEVAEPWSIDFAFGLDDQQLARTVDLRGEPGGLSTELARQALDNPPGSRDLDVVNSERWRRAEIPALGGHSNAIALARFYLALQQGGELDGARLVRRATAEAMFEPQMTAVDAVLGEEMTWALGVGVDEEDWGMGGIGGSYAGIDPRIGLVEAYVTVTMGGHDRSMLVGEATRAVAG